MKKFLLLLSLCFSLNSIYSQVEDTLENRKGAPRVFINCDYCDIQYFKNEVAFLNFVRDRRLADVVVLIRSIQTGSGGTEYTLEFNGEGNYKDLVTKEVFNSEPNMSDSDVRVGLKDALCKGVLPYLLKSPLAANVVYTVEGLDENQQADKVKDKWNLWLFNISGGINGDGQSYNKNFSFNSNFSANRTSEKNRFELGYFQWANHSTFIIDDSTTIKSFRNNYGLYGLDAVSIGKHWAIGYMASMFSSSVQNIQNSTTFSPTVEYNVFPYSEATKRQLRFNYRVSGRYVDFYEETYLNRMNDWYFLQSLIMTFRQVEKWGSLYCNIASYQFFGKEKFYKVSISPNISWNIAKGLNLNLGGNFSVINDQYFLRKEDVSSEYILLGQAQLKSNYSYYFYTGLNFSFGSIYNNVVNVRFNMDGDSW